MNEVICNVATCKFRTKLSVCKLTQIQIDYWAYPAEGALTCKNREDKK